MRKGFRVSSRIFPAKYLAAVRNIPDWIAALVNAMFRTVAKYCGDVFLTHHSYSKRWRTGWSIHTATGAMESVGDISRVGSAPISTDDVGEFAGGYLIMPPALGVIVHVEIIEAIGAGGVFSEQAGFYIRPVNRESIKRPADQWRMFFAFICPGGINTNWIFVMSDKRHPGWDGHPAVIHDVRCVHAAGVEGVEEDNAIDGHADGAHVQRVVGIVFGRHEMLGIFFWIERNVVSLVLLLDIVGIAKSFLRKFSGGVVGQAMRVNGHAGLIKCDGHVV